jgi:hypothetical protein
MMTRIEPSAQLSELTPRQVAREFRRLVADGARIRPAGEARIDPLRLLSEGYTPKYKIELFSTIYYLTNIRQNPDIRFFVTYVVQRGSATARIEIYPRIFYKDISLVWRSASHFVSSETENWIGKGDVETIIEDGEEMVCSFEQTTDLPLEIQTAVEGLVRRVRRIPIDDVALDLVLRRAPNDRIEPYRDFTEPRRRAQSDRRNLINSGRKVARFTRKNDPTSLEFAAGFEPDFGGGILEISTSRSKLYGGGLRRFRILSRNQRIQYLFIAGPRIAWIIPPQATTTEIMSFGVRTIDVAVDEAMCIPGYEYHFIDESEDPPVLFSQIPEGFVGESSEFDPTRSDASPWLDRLPVIQDFRRRVLKSQSAVSQLRRSG